MNIQIDVTGREGKPGHFKEKEKKQQSKERERERLIKIDIKIIMITPVLSNISRGGEGI